MESFKNEIKRRIKWILMFSICFGSVIIIALVIKWKGGIGSEIGLPIEVLVASFSGVVITAAFRIQKYKKALRTEESLEVLHINETDERYHTIVFKTSKTCFNILLAALGVIGIIMPFFSWIIFYTVGSILIAVLILYFVVFYYYSKKF